jgi:acyl-CoA reductase-like NAD-dependent aldehyde dehydrogenase
MHTIQNAIDGRKVTSTSRRVAPVFNPATGDPIAELPLSTAAEVDAAVAAAKQAAIDWGTTQPLKRIKHMFRFKELLDRNAEAISARSRTSMAKPTLTRRANLPAGSTSSISPAAFRISSRASTAAM